MASRWKICANAIAGANVSGPKGSLDGAQQAYTIAANDQIAAAEAYKPIIIAYRNGAPVTIGDVAVIVDGLENDRTGGWYQGRRPSYHRYPAGRPAPM